MFIFLTLSNGIIIKRQQSSNKGIAISLYMNIFAFMMIS